MIVRRLFAVGVSCLALVALVAPPGKATVATSLKLSPKVGPPTTVTKAKGTGYTGGETVDVFFDGALVATATAKPDGSFAKRFTVPATAQPGSHDVLAHGESSGREARASFLVRTPWTQFRFDEGHAGLNPYENTVSPSNASTLVNGWRLGTGGPVISAPTYFAGLIFEGSNDHKLRAIFPTTGRVKWSKALDGPILAAPAEICTPPDPCHIFAATNSALGGVYAFGISGKQAWHVTVGGPVSASPLIACTPPHPCVPQLVVADVQGLVEGLDLGDGHVLWSANVTGKPSVPAATGQSNPPDPDRILITTDQGNVYALSSVDGSVQWSAHVSGMPTSPAATHGFNPQPDPPGFGEVVLATDLGMAYELNGATGHMDRSWALAGPAQKAPALGDVNGDGSADVVVGEQAPAGSDTRRASPGPTAVELQAFAVDGTQIWSTNLGVSTLSAPVLANGLVALGLEDGTFRLYRWSDGKMAFGFQTKSPVRSSPMIADGRIVVGSNDHGIYEFQLPG